MPSCPNPHGGPETVHRAGPPTWSPRSALPVHAQGPDGSCASRAPCCRASREHRQRGVAKHCCASHRRLPPRTRVGAPSTPCLGRPSLDVLRMHGKAAPDGARRSRSASFSACLGSCAGALRASTTRCKRCCQCETAPPHAQLGSLARRDWQVCAVCARGCAHLMCLKCAGAMRSGCTHHEMVFPRR